MPKIVESGRLTVDNEKSSSAMPAAAKIRVGSQMVGEMDSILRTVTCPNHMPRKAEKAATSPSIFMLAPELMQFIGGCFMGRARLLLQLLSPPQPGCRAFVDGREPMSLFSLP